MPLPKACLYSRCCGSTPGGGIESIIAGDNVTVDDSDPLNPIVSAADASLPPLTNSLIRIGDVGNAAQERPISGDMVITNTGVVTLVGAVRVLTQKFSFNSAEILALNVTPQVISLGPGVNRAIDLLSASVRLTFGTTPYIGNTVLRIRPVGGTTNYLASNSNVLAGGVNRHGTFGLLEGVNNMIENVTLELLIDGAPATGGDGVIDVRVTYKIMQL